VVDWSEDAASRLRQARRLVAGALDAWVVADSPLGWAQMGRRLRHSTGWDPERTIAFSSLADIRLIEMAGPDVFEGLRGALPDSGTWRIGGGLLLRYPHRTSTTSQKSWVERPHRVSSVRLMVPIGNRVYGEVCWGRLWCEASG